LRQQNLDRLPPPENPPLFERYAEQIKGRTTGKETEEKDWSNGVWEMA
jgi:hypothetical protein